MIVIGGFFAALVAGGSARAEDEAAATELVQSFQTQINGAMTDPALAADERDHRLRAVLLDHVNFDAMARHAMGPYWDGMDPQAQETYRAAFNGHLLGVYGRQVGGMVRSGMTIGATETVDDDLYRVSSSIGASGQGAMTADWMVADADGRLGIVDVVVSGVSILETKQSEMMAVAGREGFDTLITRLQAER